MRCALLTVLCVSGIVCQSWFASAEGTWSERLGLLFRDDCQEDVGLRGLFVWLVAWATRRGQQRSGHCESREIRCRADQTMTGLQVRYARLEKGDRDLYDFKTRCAATWQSWLGMRIAEHSDHEEAEASICASGSSVTGVQVMRGRNDRRDWDYYNFRLRCGKQWSEPLGLAFDGLRETRSATCPSGSAVAGLRVHRGFQDWGDLCQILFEPCLFMVALAPSHDSTTIALRVLRDTYEFQLFCTTPADKADKPRSGRRSAEHLPPDSTRKTKKGGRGTEREKTPGRSKAPSYSASAFGSRAADFEAAAEEVRREMRIQADKAAAQSVKDEL